METLFYTPSSQSIPLVVPYQAELVLLSLSIAVVSSFAGLSVIARIHAAQKARSRVSWLWLGGGALSGGGGFWAMHFIGLLALQFPLAVAYDLNITLLSVLPPTIGWGTILFVFSRPRKNKWTLFSGAMRLCFCFGATHIIGMMALEGIDRQIVMLFDPSKLVAAGFVAVLAPTSAVFLGNWLLPNPEVPPRFAAKLKWSLNYGLTTAAMHYAMVYATVF
ncbi:MAG: MHYT domain-containing protein, partial [Gammaproteobacteria bacterium]